MEQRGGRPPAAPVERLRGVAIGAEKSIHLRAASRMPTMTKLDPLMAIRRLDRMRGSILQDSADC